MRTRWLTMAVVALATLVILAGCSSGVQTAPEVGKKAPDFTLQTLDGSEARLRDFSGHPIVLNFWATWCPPCTQEMPTLQRIHEKMADSGVVVVGVNVGDSPATVKAFVEKVGVEFPILLDPMGKIASKYRVRGLPSTFWIDKSGVIKDITVGGPMPEEFIHEQLKQIR